jgi:hypothetical protein
MLSTVKSVIPARFAQCYSRSHNVSAKKGSFLTVGRVLIVFWSYAYSVSAQVKGHSNFGIEGRFKK